MKSRQIKEFVFGFIVGPTGLLILELLSMKIQRKKSEIIWYMILYPISAIMLLILLFDIYTGRVYIKNGTTLPPQAYILVLPALLHSMYKILRYGPHK